MREVVSTTATNERNESLSRLLSPGGWRVRWLYLVDAVSLFALMVAITTVRFGFTWPDHSRTEYLVGFGIATLVHLVVSYFGGLYDREHRLGAPPRLARATSITLIAVLIDSALSLGADKFLMPRLNLAVFAVLATFLLAFNRWLARTVRTARFGRPLVLLVGRPDDIALAEEHLADTDRDARVVGRRSAAEDLEAAVIETGASEVLLLSDTDLNTIYPQPLGALENRYVGIYQRLSPTDTLLGVGRTLQIAGVPFVPLRSHALPRSKGQLKRLLDLAYLLLASPVLVPLTAIVLVYARVFAGNGVLFRQERIGRDGLTFTMVKVRTMYHGAEDRTGAVLAERDDPRVIPALAWLRATRLDELPQLWNVLRGDMSLVGPRPERPELAASFEQIIPGYGRRHDIRPGITGLAQIDGGYHTDPEYKLGHDLQYLVNWSPVLDLQLLFRSLVVMALRRH